MGTEEPPKHKIDAPGRESGKKLLHSRLIKKPDNMSTLTYSWNVRGTFNGDFVGASGTTASEGAPFNHSSWIWGGLGHYGLGFMKGGHKVNPCEKYPFHMTRHWYGEDGAHIWSSHTITGAEG